MFEKIDFTNNPKHGIVREVRKIRNDAVTSFLKSYSSELSKLAEEDKDFDVTNAMVYLLKEHPDEFMEFQKKGEETDYICAISLATNKIWTIDELDELTFDEVEKLYDKSLETLGGDINRFFGKFLSNQTMNTIEEKPKKPTMRKKVEKLQTKN